MAVCALVLVGWDLAAGRLAMSGPVMLLIAACPCLELTAAPLFRFGFFSTAPALILALAPSGGTGGAVLAALWALVVRTLARG
ncbi:MAG: hypothetical protein AB1758_36305, partial [Candidatus Eremiobacterota bacterium]